ncbi:hypothetical protein DN752_16365 [Echinicola strongylocentroti]|uniref:Sigma-70 family RNA polymerase sigma factor n=1 Tax=Echinicola strongylocentroti TaxID=1795355 RepID=A0A2Z4IKC5_9BACT|nr:sigma-70 family RNA polymerase sigma factor [Echinicola strongylocentroti]AWW31571.1 hypothetical protein DN752_16365 [Echinicola strongylocentroti]
MTSLSLSYSEKGDTQLWLDMKAGDSEAFEQIYRDHVDFIIRYGNSFTDDQAVIDDCVQEVFCRIWQKRSLLKVTDNVRYYVMAAFRKELLKFLKKRSKSNSLFGVLFPGAGVNFEASLEVDIIREESRRSQIELLNRAMVKLSSRQREVVYLKFYNELSIDEIKEVMALDRKAVYNALSKAMMVMRKELKK